MDDMKTSIVRAVVICAAALLVSVPGFTQPLPETIDAVNSDGVSDADLIVVRKSLVVASEALAAYFADAALEDAIRGARVTVTVHAGENGLASTDRATIRSGTTDGTPATYFAEIHVLALSRHRPNAITASGEPKDELYMRRLITHELATAWLDLASRLKPHGWRFHAAPDWFVQGYEEYLGLTCSGDAVRSRSLARYTQVVLDDPARVDAEFGLDVREPYITGAVLMRFMHERFGRERILAVLRSDRPTFGSAARHELGMDPHAFVAAWRAWLEGKSAEQTTSGAG